MKGKQMIKIIAAIISAIVGALVGFLVVSFIVWDTCPGNWSQDARFISLWLGGIVGVATMLISFNELND